MSAKLHEIWLELFVLAASFDRPDKLVLLLKIE